jgi:hypothetical protein
MRSNGKTAWLITWEGPDSEYNGRCKIVAILAPQMGRKSIISLLPILYYSEYNFGLDEKMGFCVPKKGDTFFREAYRDINLEFWYGHYLHEYLCARKVKGLRVEENQTDICKSTLYWTELPKYVLKSDDPLPTNPATLLKEVQGARKRSYTYSIRPRIEDRERRRATALRKSGEAPTPT